MIRVALGTFALAVGLLGWTIWAAWRVEDISGPAAPTATRAVRRDAASSERYELPRVLAAVEKDVFHPARRRPGARFHLPTEAAAPSTPDPGVRVIGTAVSPDGGFAMCALGTGAPRIVRIGERLGDWTLNRVTPGAAEFATPSGTTVVVRIAKVGS